MLLLKFIKFNMTVHSGFVSDFFYFGFLTNFREILLAVLGFQDRLSERYNCKIMFSKLLWLYFYLVSFKNSVQCSETLTANACFNTIICLTFKNCVDQSFNTIN